MIVRLVKLPPAVRGTTVTDEDGNYNVYINKNLNYETQIKVFEHELAHIQNGDFGSEESVMCLEERANYKSLKKDKLFLCID